MTGTDVEAVLDLRGWPHTVNGPDDYLTLWSQLEPALHGRELRSGGTHTWEASEGTITLEIVRLADGVRLVDPATRFGIVAVRERGHLLYRCATCDGAGRGSYGSFRCRSCADEGRPERVCVEHVVMLDGALTPSCPQHHPACRSCGQRATFWCGGPACRAAVAWCERHRQRHPQDPDTDYCPGCYRSAFPTCGEGACGAVGTVVCDWLDGREQPCGQQACTKHALRWQVFGPERVGLGLCRRHSDVRSLTADELMYQICAGGARRRDVRIPTLRAFGHNLRRSGHPELAVDYRSIRSRLKALEADLGRRGHADSVRAIGRAAPRWDRELADTEGDSKKGELLMERLRQLVRGQDARWGAEIAAQLRLAEFRKARSGPGGDRAAILWIRLPDALRGHFIGPKGARVNAYKSQLGVEIRIEDDRRGGRR